MRAAAKVVRLFLPALAAAAVNVVAAGPARADPATHELAVSAKTFAGTGKLAAAQFGRL